MAVMYVTGRCERSALITVPPLTNGFPPNPNICLIALCLLGKVLLCCDFRPTPRLSKLRGNYFPSKISAEASRKPYFQKSLCLEHAKLILTLLGASPSTRPASPQPLVFLTSRNPGPTHSSHSCIRNKSLKRERKKNKELGCNFLRESSSIVQCS